MKGCSIFFYSIKEGFKSLRKNRMFTIASIGTVSACLFLFGLFYFFVGNFQYMIHRVGTSVGVTVFFEEGVTQEQIANIGDQIKARPEVSKLVYVSAEQAWETFKEKMFRDERKELADTFGAENPLKDSASYEIYLNHISGQESLVDYLETVKGIRQVNRSDEMARNLGNVNTLIGYISGTIILILLIVAIFLIRTTISAGISVRRQEIAIMRLMGASDYYIRAPFVAEGVFIGIVGALLPLIVLFVLYERVLAYFSSRFAMLSNFLEFLPAGQVFQALVPVLFSLGIGIGFLGSYLTVRKHLNI